MWIWQQSTTLQNVNGIQTIFHLLQSYTFFRLEQTFFILKRLFSESKNYFPIG